MQSSTSLQENRVVTVLRWVARVAGVIIALVFVLSVYYAFFPVDPLQIVGPGQWVVSAITGAGVVLALLGSFFWKGLSEVVGGLLLVGVGAWIGFQYWPLEIGELGGGAFFAAPGALFIACGWYTLAHRSRHATPTPA